MKLEGKVLREGEWCGCPLYGIVYFATHPVLVCELRPDTPLKYFVVVTFFFFFYYFYLPNYLVWINSFLSQNFSF